MHRQAALRSGGTSTAPILASLAENKRRRSAGDSDKRPKADNAKDASVSRKAVSTEKQIRRGLIGDLVAFYEAEKTSSPQDGIIQFTVPSEMDKSDFTYQLGKTFETIIHDQSNTEDFIAIVYRHFPSSQNKLIRALEPEAKKAYDLKYPEGQVTVSPVATDLDSLSQEPKPEPEQMDEDVPAAAQPADVPVADPIAAARDDVHQFLETLGLFKDSSNPAIIALKPRIAAAELEAASLVTRTDEQLQRQQQLAQTTIDKMTRWKMFAQTALNTEKAKLAAQEAANKAIQDRLAAAKSKMNR